LPFTIPAGRSYGAETENIAGLSQILFVFQWAHGYNEAARLQPTDTSFPGERCGLNSLENILGGA